MSIKIVLKKGKEKKINVDKERSLDFFYLLSYICSFVLDNAHLIFFVFSFGFKVLFDEERISANQVREAVLLINYVRRGSN